MPHPCASAACKPEVIDRALNVGVLIVWGGGLRTNMDDQFSRRDHLDVR
jgi:hypothetical protein